MSDSWSTTHPSILLEEALGRIKTIASDEGPIIVEHRHYRAAKSPTRMIFDDAEALELYMRTRASPGDSFLIWSYEACCSDGNLAVAGKIPRADGLTPDGGAY